MPSIKDTFDHLNSIDWNFPRTGTLAKSVHTFHWFPGNFIPQIPAHLIQILSKPGDLVLDPFMGSGTTVLEATRLGRRALGSDVLTSCCFVASGKLQGLLSGLSASHKQTILQSMAWPDLCESESAGKNEEGTNLELSRWYTPRTLMRLRYIWQLIEGFPGHVRPVLEMIFSDVLFSSASTRASKTRTGKIRRHHWGWVADNVRPQNLFDVDVVSAFISRVIAFPEESTVRQASNAGAQVIQQDARSLSQASESVDLIVTSPPYVGVIDYARANRLLYLWKNWDMNAERTFEIGARYKRARRLIVEDYLKEMDACWSEAERVLKQGAFIAVVIGESKKFPGTVKKTIGNLETRCQLIWGPTPRTPVRRRVSDAAGLDPVEFLAVFRK